MSELIPYDPSLLGLLKSDFNNLGIPLPYIKEIFLIETNIAGTSYLNLTEIEKQILDGEFIIFKREPQNKYDSLAILIFDERGNKLGYIPRDKNEILARLMDAGKVVFGKLKNREWIKEWLKINIQVYLRDL